MKTASTIQDAAMRGSSRLATSMRTTCDGVHSVVGGSSEEEVLQSDHCVHNIVNIAYLVNICQTLVTQDSNGAYFPLSGDVQEERLLNLPKTGAIG